VLNHPARATFPVCRRWRVTRLMMHTVPPAPRRFATEGAEVGLPGTAAEFAGSFGLPLIDPAQHRIPEASDRSSGRAATLDLITRDTRRHRWKEPWERQPLVETPAVAKACIALALQILLSAR
jgi:hypothetical protein